MPRFIILLTFVFLSIPSVASEINLENYDLSRLSCAFAASFRENNVNEQRNLDDEPIACGEILATWDKDEVATRVDEMLVDDLGASSVAYLVVSSVVTPLIQHGIQLRKVCGSCTDFTDDSGAFADICGPDVHGHNSTVSGLLVVPLDTTSGILSGTFPGFIFGHGTSISEFPTARWTSFMLFSIVPASSGVVSIVPDYLGYGESSETAYKSYTVKRAYQTSTIPLWYKARQILEEETSCSSALADATVILGYSEGGYASVAIADGLSSLGVDIIRVEAGAGPYRVGTITIPYLVNSVLLGNFPADEQRVLALLGSAYSSTNPNVANFGKGQDILKASTRDFYVDLIKVGESSRSVNDAVPDDDPLTIFDDDFIAWAKEIIETQDTDPCATNFVVGFNDFLCPAVAENDLTETLESVTYRVNLCHSVDDEIVSYDSLPDVTQNPTYLSVTSVTGPHADAAAACLLSGMQSLSSDEVRNFEFQDKHSTTGCPSELNGFSPTSSPSEPPSAVPTPTSDAVETNCSFTLTCSLTTMAVAWLFRT